MGTTVGLGFSCHLGWIAASAVLVRDRAITAVVTFRLATARDGDRLAQEPYHVAGGFDGLARVPPPSDPAGAIRKGLARQATQTRKSLAACLACLEGWPPAAVAAVLTARGRQAAALSRVLASHAQIHIAEGNAVRNSIADACRAEGLEVIELDRRGLSGMLSTRFGQDEPAALHGLAAMQPTNRGAWRKEEKICALAAWYASVT
ncbi:MAG: hypothetical protein PVH91_12640 [Pseudomonadales bacterium]